MPIFPLLKTNAVAQYPAKKTLQFQNQTLRFLDGSEQRYRDCPAPLRRWEILLDQLDETEMAALEEFFVADQGVFGTFAFCDPWSLLEYPHCSLGSDEMDLKSLAELSGSASLLVVENRI